MRFLSDELHRLEFSSRMIAQFFTHGHFASNFSTGASAADFYEQIPIILREILYRLNDSDSAVLKANNAAFSALSIHVPAEELVKHVEFIRNVLASIVSDARRRKGGVGDGEFFLPGFNLPKGALLHWLYPSWISPT